MRQITFIIVLFISFQVTPQAEVITTKLALNEIQKSLNETINQAMDRADYSVAQAAIQALSVLDAWKETNSDLLDKAFSEIDSNSRNLFSRMESISNEINNGFSNHLENADELVVKANQITENLPTSGKRSFILDYSPKVIYPTSDETILFTIKGVNLDKSEAKYKLQNGNYIELNILGPTRASIQLPVSEISFDHNKPNTALLEIEHETRDGSYLFIIPAYDDVKRKLLVSCLPIEAGKYELNGTRNYEKEDRRMYTSNAGRFEATNSNVNKMANPLEGYRWDLRNGEESRKEFKVVTTGGGEKGRCQIINWNASNEHGISIQARCDEIREVSARGIRWKPGYIHCGVEGPVYKMVSTTEPIAKSSGILNWNIDKSIPIPNNLESFQLRIKSYDGKERIISNDYSDGIIKVIKNNKNIVIRSLPPENL